MLHGSARSCDQPSGRRRERLPAGASWRVWVGRRASSGRAGAGPGRAGAPTSKRRGGDPSAAGCWPAWRRPPRRTRRPPRPSAEVSSRAARRSGGGSTSRREPSREPELAEQGHAEHVVGELPRSAPVRACTRRASPTVSSSAPSAMPASMAAWTQLAQRRDAVGRNGGQSACANDGEVVDPHVVVLRGRRRRWSAGPGSAQSSWMATPGAFRPRPCTVRCSPRGPRTCTATWSASRAPVRVTLRPVRRQAPGRGPGPTRYSPGGRSPGSARGVAEERASAPTRAQRSARAARRWCRAGSARRT